ncbi:MAG: hypothetical protein FD155_368 [Bacteroidetes bacterium]|nr:MAG: hypothetical protein FD155_368 [Bacteroidota bacterium]
MKTDSLEDFIRSNKEAFDELEPDPRLWEGIQSSLKQPSKKIMLPFLLKISTVAAIFIAGYFFSMLVNTRPDAAPVAQAPSESIRVLNEAKAYYTQQIDERSQLVFQLASDKPELTEDLKHEFEALDALYISLEKDLGDEVATETVVEAMIQHYRIKLELLEDMLMQLQAASGDKEKEASHVL